MASSSLPWADAHAGALSALDASAVVELLDHVEQLPPGATGALMVGPRAHPKGTVLIEHGRVCWAVADGMRNRMTDLLRYQSLSPLDPAQIEEIYRRCREQKTALGETLVESGLVSPNGLRRALRQHTAEALALLSRARPMDGLGWVEHRQSRYDARFTFPPGELLVGLGGLRMASRVGAAQAILRNTIDDCAVGIAFARAPGMAMPLPIAATAIETVSVRNLLEVGRWAMGTLDLAEAFAHERGLVGAVTALGHGLLSWFEDGVVYVLLCEDPSEFAVGIVKHRRAHAHRA